jgi:hypothetical protein
MRRIALLCAVVCLGTAGGAVAWGQTISKHPAASHTTRRHKTKSRPKHKTTTKHRKTSSSTTQARQTVTGTQSAATSSATSDPTLFGDENVESSADNNKSGLAEAFPFAGQTGGTAHAINVYLDSHNKASTIVAAIYSDNNGQPGSRLVSGSLSSPKAGAWNTVSIASTAVGSSGRYWIAILGKNGTAYFRDRSQGPCQSFNSSRTSLTSLPATWTSGSQWTTCPVSAYVTGTLTATIASAPAAPTTTTTSTTTTSSPLAPLPAPPVVLFAPQISGTAMQGQTLTTDNGTWLDSPTSYGYQWQDCDTNGLNCANISGATANTYTLTGNDVGNTIRVLVTASNSGGSASASSAQTNTVQGIPAPTNTAPPAISGTTTQGQTLSTSNGTWTGSPTSYSYQWQDCDTNGASCTNISGANSSSYALTAADVGNTIRVVVTASNAGGFTAAISNQTAVVQAPAPPPAPSNTALPSISGTTTQGQTLTAAKGSWNGSPTSYAYQWRDCNSSGASCTNISGATAGTYTLASGDVGDTIRVVVTATNAGGSTPATSNQTAAIASSTPSAPSNTALPSISGTTTQGQTLSTSNGSWNGSPTGYAYQWRDCDSSGANCSNISGATSSSYTLAAGDVGDTIRVVVTATNAGGSTPATSNQTAAIASSGGGGGTPTNCLGTTGSGQVNYTSLDNCGYPSPNTTGVPAGTTLTTVSSINCSNQTINAVSTSGNVTVGSNCTITNSRLTGGQITIQSGVTGVTFSHDEISGPYTGSASSPSCTYSSSNGTTSDVLAEGAATAVTLNYDYLHCAAEPLNGNFQVSNSYILADECWGPCGSGSTTHNEALYIAGGGSGGTKVEHNTILNEYSQTAGIFGDDHAWGPIQNLTINNNLVACGGDNGAIATGAAGDGDSGVSITNNRLSYVYSTSMPSGNSTAATWSGNYRDDNLQSVAANG